MMPQSTVFCVFVGAGEEAIKYQVTTRDTHLPQAHLTNT